MKAEECTCCQCKRATAVAFWPCIDIDIQASPYCRACLDKVQKELLIKIALEEYEPRPKWVDSIVSGELVAV
jgi:hypothetical protein